MPLFSDATLSDLTLRGIDFGAFVSETTSYTAEVANGQSQTTVTPILSHSKASYFITLGGAVHSDGDVPLQVGENIIMVEVTAEDGVTRRTYTVTVTRDDINGSDATPQPTLEDPCVQEIDQDNLVEGHWDGTCLSEKQAPGGDGDRFARLYTFTLISATDIEISLRSTEDTYLYLLGGHGESGEILHYNDDVVFGVDTNSQLSVALEPGEYTIEATTFDPKTTGTFILAVRDLASAEDQSLQPDPEGCVSSVEGNTIIYSNWDSACVSERLAQEGSGERYSRFYALTLTEPANVIVTLESGEDTYLYLLEGHGKDGNILFEEDDIIYGVNTNSRLTERLEPGNYTIEATSYYAEKQGNFTLTIEGLDSSM